MRARPAVAAWLFAVAVFVLAVSPAEGALSEALRRRFDRAISKRMARDSAGRYYLLIESTDRHGQATFSLRAARDGTATDLESFSPAVQPSFLGGIEDPVIAGGIAIDRHDRLHLVWNTERGRTSYSRLDLNGLQSVDRLADPQLWTNPATQSPGSLAIATTSSRVGDLTAAPDGDVWLTWTVTSANHRTSVFVGSAGRGRWNSYLVANGYGIAPPTLLVDEAGRLSVAWHDIYEETYYATGDVTRRGAATEWSVSRLGSARAFDRDHQNIDSGRGRRPVLLRSGGKTIAVYESDYSYIEYLFPGAAAPIKHDLTRSDKRFVWDTSHSPQIATDRYGISWLFFIESARQRVFYARWLGTKWSQIYDGDWLTRNSVRLEDNRLSIDQIAVEEKPSRRESAGGIGVLLTHLTGSSQTAFRTIPVPSLEARRGKKLLFLDLLEVMSLDGVEVKLNQPAKYAGNPIITPGGKDDFDATTSGSFLRVLKERNKYRMWYSGLFEDQRRPWWEWYRVGYAESRDGYLFKKVPLGLAAFRGNRNTNIIPDLPYVPMVCDDLGDPDPSRRYKLLKFSNSGIQNEEAKAGRVDPWRDVFNGALFTSADGIHWVEQPAEIAFPTGRPFSFIPQTVFHDALERNPAKRYKAYGFSSLNLARRGGSYAYSGDAIHWTAYAQNPVLDALARGVPPVRGGKVEQIHDTVVWPYQGYYLAFFQYQYNGERQDVELAVSRDGEHFVFVRPGEKVIPLGKPGAFDCSAVSASLPLIDGDELKFYYGGSCGEQTGSAGVATLRIDGLTDLRLEKNARAGSMTTIPVSRGDATEIYLNARCTAADFLQVELIDASTGHVVPGFSRDESARVTGDSARQRVEWKNAKLSALKARSFQVRVHFAGAAGSPRLYAIEFQ